MSKRFERSCRAGVAGALVLVVGLGLSGCGAGQKPAAASSPAGASAGGASSGAQAAKPPTATASSPGAAGPAAKLGASGAEALALGKATFQSAGCARCHSVDGSDDTGPTWLKAYGTKRKLADGTTVMIDEDYVRRSISEPKAQVADGYEPVMPSYRSTLTPDQVFALVAYYKSLAGQ